MSVKIRKYLTEILLVTAIAVIVFMIAYIGVYKTVMLKNAVVHSSEFTKLPDGTERMIVVDYETSPLQYIVYADRVTGVMYISTASGLSPLYVGDGHLMIYEEY